MISFDWIGCALALVGSLLLAMNTRISGWGFVAYFFSNCAWITFAASNGINSLLLMQIGFTLTSLLGIYRWRRNLKGLPDPVAMVH